MIQTKKISELPASTSIDGLYTIGTDANNESCKVNIRDVFGAAIEAGVETAKDELQDGIDAVDAAKPDRTELSAVLVGVTLNEAAASVSLTFDVYNAVTKTSAQITKILPIASADACGLMPKESYSALTQAVSDIQALQQQGGRFIGQSFATKADLDAFTPTGINAGDFTYVLDDEAHNDAATRYIFDGSNFQFGYVIDYDPVGLADAVTAGLVKSSEPGEYTGGKVFVEADGTMSVIGWAEMADNAGGGGVVTPNDCFCYVFRNSQLYKRGGEHLIDLTGAEWNADTAYWLIVQADEYQEFVMTKGVHQSGLWSGALCLHVLHRGFGWGESGNLISAEWAQNISSGIPVLHAIASHWTSPDIVAVALRGGRTYNLFGLRVGQFGISSSAAADTGYNDGFAPEPFVSAAAYGKVFDANWADQGNRRWTQSFDGTAPRDGCIYACVNGLWKAVDAVLVKHTVTFYLDGGVGYSGQQNSHTLQYEHNAPFSYPGGPTRSGSTFQGWYTGSHGSGQAVPYGTAVTGNITVYAKWLQ